MKLRSRPTSFYVKLRLVVLASCITYLIIAFTYRSLDSRRGNRMENEQFIRSSPSWPDRVACRWLGICGGMNWWKGYRKSQPQPQASEKNSTSPTRSPHDWTDAWTDPNADPESWTKEERRLRKIPDYVLEYAPILHLYGQEKYWPSDIAEHLANTYAKLDNDTIPDFKLNLWNLADLNKYNGGVVFLTSKDDPEKNPEWMLSPHNIPGVPGGKATPVESTPGKRKGKKHVKAQAKEEGWSHVEPRYKSVEQENAHLEGDEDSEGEEPAFEIKLPHLSSHDGGEQQPLRQRRKSALRDSEDTQVPIKGDADPSMRSNAPGFLICIDKGEGIVDAFWFYFYSFNEGNTVLGIRFGNHVGDWEHTMMRFQHGKPKAVYLSRHAWGSIYTYDALEKIGKRPIVYSADGSHAHYPSPGRQDYVLPLGLLHDNTSKGPLWDPVLNLKSFTYDPDSDNLRASTLNPKAPTSWFHFAGRWGDKHYDLSDHRQYRFWGEYHYGNGPSGPKFKHLRRKNLCEGDKCDLKDHID